MPEIGEKTNFRLRECPFCGNPKLAAEDNGRRMFAVFCCQCGAKGPDEPNPVAATTHWNHPEIYREQEATK